MLFLMLLVDRLMWRQEASQAKIDYFKIEINVVWEPQCKSYKRTQDKLSSKTNFNVKSFIQFNYSNALQSFKLWQSNSILFNWVLVSVLVKTLGSINIECWV